MTRKKRLGRGLEALLNSTDDAPVAVTEPYLPATGPEEGDIVHLNVYEIEDNPFQPRRVFTESEISSLAESLKEHDILQPILVRKVGDTFQLISGERRLRAAIKANWDTIPARIRTADDRLVSELAIVENLQRKDLNPIEKALSFRRYIDEHQCTQEELANRLKIDRSTIANLMRLLELPNELKQALQEGRISAGHARTLLPLGDERLQMEFLNRIIEEGMSVRATEREVSDLIRSNDNIGVSKTSRPKPRNPQVEALTQQFKEMLGTKVVIKPGAKQKGQIVIHYKNNEEFERIQAILASGVNIDRRAA